MLERLHEKCISGGLLSRLAVSFLLGGLAALAMPPLYLLPLLFPSLIGLYWLVQSAQRPRTAFALGWVYGTGYFVTGLYWIGNAFMVNADKHALMAIPAVVGLSVFLALSIACVCWCQRIFFRRDRPGFGGVMAFAALWAFFEWVRLWAFTGFPWNLLGSAWTFSDAMVQSVAYIGTFGLSLLTVFVFCSPAVLGEARVSAAHWGRWRAPILFVGIVGLLWVGGAWRLSENQTAYEPGITLRLVQPNIPQAMKWKKDLKNGHVMRQLDMSLNGSSGLSGSSGQPPTHVIWAETAVPFVLAHDTSILGALARAAPEDGVLITGIVRSNLAQGNTEKPKFWNSLVAVNATADIVSHYDKVHLVPFGEYMPLEDILPFEKLTAGAGSFTQGVSRQLTEVPGLPPFSPLICYEVIFPGEVSADNGRPGWLLNLTNDAWYGISTGPYQHFEATRLRAVEEALPVVRVANTGISGVIDAYGRVVSSLPLDSAGVLDAALPSPGAVTPYARYGNSLPLMICVISFAAGILMIRRKLASSD